MFSFHFFRLIDAILGPPSSLLGACQLDPETIYVKMVDVLRQSGFWSDGPTLLTNLPDEDFFDAKQLLAKITLGRCSTPYDFNQVSSCSINDESILSGSYTSSHDLSTASDSSLCSSLSSTLSPSLSSTLSSDQSFQSAISSGLPDQTAQSAFTSGLTDQSVQSLLTSGLPSQSEISVISELTNQSTQSVISAITEYTDVSTDASTLPLLPHLDGDVALWRVPDLVGDLTDYIVELTKHEHRILDHQKMLIDLLFGPIRAGPGVVTPEMIEPQGLPVPTPAPYPLGIKNLESEGEEMELLEQEVRRTMTVKDPDPNIALFIKDVTGVKTQEERAGIRKYFLNKTTKERLEAMYQRIVESMKLDNPELARNINQMAYDIQKGNLGFSKPQWAS